MNNPELDEFEEICDNEEWFEKLTPKQLDDIEFAIYYNN